MSDPFASTDNDAVGDDPFGNDDDDLGAYGADVGGDEGGFNFGDGDDNDLDNLGGDNENDEDDNEQEQEQEEEEDAFGLCGDGGDNNENEEPSLGDFGGDGDDEGVALQSSKYLEWENDHLSEVSRAREEARVAKEEVKEKGRAELDEFHRARAARIAATKQQNSDDERNNAAELSMIMENGSSWEKVGKLVNLNSNKDTSGITKNDRLRKLLIQLKNEGASSA